MAVEENTLAKTEEARVINLSFYHNPTAVQLGGYRVKIDPVYLGTKIRSDLDPVAIRLSDPSTKLTIARWQEGYGADSSDVKIWHKATIPASVPEPIIIYDRGVVSEDATDDEHKIKVTDLSFNKTTLVSGAQVAWWGGDARNVLNSWTGRHLVIDGNNIWHLVYLKKVGSVDRVYHAYSSDGGLNWTHEQIDTSWAGEQIWPSCVIDKNSTIHFTWSEEDTGDTSHRALKYRNKTALGAWSAVETLSAATTPAGGYNEMSCLQVAYDGLTLGVVWTGMKDGLSVYNIVYKERSSGGVWGSQTWLTSDGSGDGFYWPTIDFDNSGYPHLAYSRNTVGSRNVFYQKKTAGGWQAAETVTSHVSETNITRYFSNIIVDDNGYVHIAYGVASGSSNDIYYRKRTTSWQDRESVYNQCYGSVQLQLQRDGSLVMGISRLFTVPTPNAHYLSLMQKVVGGSWTKIYDIETDDTKDAPPPQLLWARFPIIDGQYISYSQQYAVVVYALASSSDNTSVDIKIAAHPNAVIGAIPDAIATSTYRNNIRGKICRSKVYAARVSPCAI